MLGTGLMSAMIDGALLRGGDGLFHPTAARRDRLSAPGFDLDYRVTELGVSKLDEFGIDFDALAGRQRPLVRYCVDWSEQRHHLAGSLGAAIADRMFELGWVSRRRDTRAVRVSDEGRDGLMETFGLELTEAAAR
jgi:hypothetical protein